MESYGSKLNASHFHTAFDIRIDQLLRSRLVCDNHRAIFHATYTPRGNYTELCMIDHDDSLPGLLDNYAIHSGLFRTSTSQTGRRIDSIRPEERNIYIDLAQSIDRGRSYQRKSVSPQMAARNKYFNILPLGELHGDIDSIGHDLDSASIAKAPNHFRRGCTMSERNGISWFDHFGGSLSDATLFCRLTADKVGERFVLPECLIEKRLKGNCPTMRSMQ